MGGWAQVRHSIITNAIQTHVNDYCLLDPNWHSFVKGRSCVTQLLNIINVWLNLLNVSPTPKFDVIFFDFAKSVRHNATRCTYEEAVFTILYLWKCLEFDIFLFFVVGNRELFTGVLPLVGYRLLLEYHKGAS